MSTIIADVPDATECARCSGPIPKDGDGEYRCRYRLEDAARSTYGGSSGKLCFECWDAVNRFLEGGDQL